MEKKQTIYMQQTWSIIENTSDMMLITINSFQVGLYIILYICEYNIKLQKKSYNPNSQAGLIICFNNAESNSCTYNVEVRSDWGL